MKNRSTDKRKRVFLVSSYQEKICVCIASQMQPKQVWVSCSWKHMHSPTLIAFPRAINFHIPFTLWVLQTTAHTSLFWLTKVKTHSTIPDPRNLSAGGVLQFKTFSEHKNIAIFYLISFSAIYANIYIAFSVYIYI